MYSLSSPSHLELQERVCKRLNIKIKKIVGRCDTTALHYSVIKLPQSNNLNSSFIKIKKKKRQNQAKTKQVKLFP